MERLAVGVERLWGWRWTKAGAPGHPLLRPCWSSSVSHCPSWLPAECTGRAERCQVGAA